MIKMYALLPRRPDVAETTFHEHWRTTHADHARRITTMRRYVQDHRITMDLPGLPVAPYDGVPEVSFDDVGSAYGFRKDPNYVRYAQPDEPNFVDMERMDGLVADETVLRPGPDVGPDTEDAVLLLLLKRRPELGDEAFRAALREIAQGLDLPADVLRVVVSTSRPEPYARGIEPAYDGVIELFWASPARLEAGWPSISRGVLDHLTPIADPTRSHQLPAAPYRVVWP
jgi:hypothetical protein